MSSSPREGSQPIERSLLGGALSFEFSDCSIAAADLSKLAGESIVHEAEQSDKRLSYFIIGDGESPQTLVSTSINAEFYGSEFSLDGYSASLVLAQRIETGEQTTNHKVKKWLIPRHVEQTTKTEVLKDDPFLAVKVGDDALLPIASFARRNNGQCSYVQLGQEMYDDNFFVTAADDETTRHGLIEALRTQVSYHRQEDEEVTATIQRFVEQQGEVQSSALLEAYERQLVRRSFEKLGASKIRSELTVIGDDQSASPEQYVISNVIPACILDDGRLVSLALARPYMNDQWLGDRLSLFAITREGVAAPIASMTSQNMQFELAENISISPEDKEIATRDLIFAIIKRPPVRNVQSDLKPKYEAQNLEGKDREVAEYLFGAGMLSEYEKYRSDDYYHRTTDKVTIGANVKRHLDTFFAYPDDTYSPYPDSAPLNLALSRLEKLQTGDRDLLTRLQAGNRFAEVLGEARKCDEVLMHYVAKLALAKEGLIAIFNNVQIGKTQAKAKISAAVETNDGIYVLSITGRPESMPDEPMKPLLGATLNPVRPLLGQERVREGAFDEVHVDELIDIVSRIFAVQNK